MVYLREEHKSIYGTDLPEGPEDWICQQTRFTMGPRQYDTYNCGVFIVFVTEALTNLRVDPEILFHFDNWKFDSALMDKYRVRMGACILKKKIPDLPNLPEESESQSTPESPFRDSEISQSSQSTPWTEGISFNYLVSYNFVKFILVLLSCAIVGAPQLE